MQIIRCVNLDPILAEILLCEVHDKGIRINEGGGVEGSGGPVSWHTGTNSVHY